MTEWRYSLNWYLTMHKLCLCSQKECPPRGYHMETVNYANCKKEQNLHGKTAVDKRAWIKACMYGLANLVKYWWMLVFNNCFFFMFNSLQVHHFVKTTLLKQHNIRCTNYFYLHVLQLSNKRVNVFICPWFKTELEFSNSIRSSFFVSFQLYVNKFKKRHIKHK